MKNIFALILCIIVLFLASCGSKSEEPPQDSTFSESPYEKDYGNFSTVNKSQPSNDRQKQIKSSEKDYNTGSDYSEKRLDEILSSAKKIKNFGSLAYPNAAKFMAHYLSNSGEEYEVDMEKFLKDSIANQNMETDIEKAKQAAEELIIDGETINIYQKTESLYHNLTGDWKYCLGSYFAYVEMYGISFDGTTYTATVKYTVIDFYNWDKNDDKVIFSGLVGGIIGDVSPKDLHQLHINGQAKEILSKGETTYQISWEK